MLFFFFCLKNKIVDQAKRKRSRITKKYQAKMHFGKKEMLKKKKKLISNFKKNKK